MAAVSMASRSDGVEIAGGQVELDGVEVLVQALQPPGMGTIHSFWASSQASAICGLMAR